MRLDMILAANSSLTSDDNTEKLLGEKLERMAPVLLELLQAMRLTVSLS
jgi:hypothetical protein